MNRAAHLLDIIERGEGALKRLHPNNPMRPIIERNTRDAREKLERLA